MLLFGGRGRETLCLYHFVTVDHCIQAGWLVLQSKLISINVIGKAFAFLSNKKKTVCVDNITDADSARVCRFSSRFISLCPTIS
jgi:hypothetical protein